MNYPNRRCLVWMALTAGCLLATRSLAQEIASVRPDASPYRIINRAQYLGIGGIDYVHADNEGRRLYVPRGSAIQVFNLDNLKPTGLITNTTARGVAVDPKSHHGFSSSRPVVMWDTRTLERLKTIEVQGRPDAITFEPFTGRIYVLSHTQPNATVIDARDGSLVGTLELGGAPEQAVSDGKGRLYVVLEDKNNVAVVDVKALKVIAHYDLDGKGGPAGLALDAKRRILFAFCRKPATAVMLNADDGKILGTLPIGEGTDGGGFNPVTMEAFSSQGDGTLTIIRENSQTSFEVAQTVQTKPRAKTCTLDTKNNRIIVISTEVNATGAGNSAPFPSSPAGPSGRARPAPNAGPTLLSILVVGR